MPRQVKPKAPLGIILYEGPSLIDGAPIVVIANRIAVDSDNEKTGAMVQTWILRADITPSAALESGADRSICGDCPARPANGNFCYVRVANAPRSVWEAYQRGRYVAATAESLEWLRGRAIRLGSYGDPLAAPVDVWRNLATYAAKLTGYSHQWRTAPLVARNWLMASVDTPDEAKEASARGWRYFRVRTKGESLFTRADAAPLEFMCPASKEAGVKTNCAACGACGGLSSKANANPVIMAHGAKAVRFERWRNGELMLAAKES